MDVAEPTCNETLLVGMALVLNNIFSDNDVTPELLVGGVAASLIWPIVLLIGAIFVLAGGDN